MSVWVKIWVVCALLSMVIDAFCVPIKVGNLSIKFRSLSLMFLILAWMVYHG